ncbi:hypothetical protein P691DRAFT_812770 [Macrolepiota fuliginosa MF-IS2]|uniref:Uncharacterized protein n=1 Tax=Macrolepiota fuliginosa MF-IS2 TaxID=1400762 RepID=A0A9P6C4Y0_9AGAR|nr:hypothetical protein P691DRAFT_812770 [Macrolepiota fuliginosa MF-IS2]
MKPILTILTASAIALFTAPITLGNPLSGSPVARDDSAQICLQACWFEKPDCAEDWHAVKQGGCWTCCQSPSPSPSVCSRLCVPTPPFCPDGWSDEQFGECWTCCKDE